MGRFIQADSLSYLEPDTINGLNLYAYCKNNPINYYDPTGHSFTILAFIAFGIGFVIGGIYGGVSAEANDQSVLGGILIGGFVGGLTGFFVESLGLTLGVALAFGLGATGDFVSQMALEGKSFREVNLISLFWAGAANAMLAAVGGEMSGCAEASLMPWLDYTIFSSITSSPFLAMGMAINMGISEQAPSYTIGELFDDVVDFFDRSGKGR